MQQKSASPVDNSTSTAPPKLILYSFWQSSCSWRVRFALNLKGLPYDYRAVNLRKGEQFSPEFEKINPLHYVPALADADLVVSDSLAILLYLEEKYPHKALMPLDPGLRALNLQADVFLAPQIAVAIKRFNIDMSKFPTLSRIFNSYKALPEFLDSLPERQPDAVN